MSANQKVTLPSVLYRSMDLQLWGFLTSTLNRGEWSASYAECFTLWRQTYDWIGFRGVLDFV